MRAISQAGLYPANCRLVDAAEAEFTEAGDGKHDLLVLAFESADHPLEPWMKRALELCADYGGEYPKCLRTIEPFLVSAKALSFLYCGRDLVHAIDANDSCFL